MQYVYLIQADKYHKIGIAGDPQSRLAQLQTGNPYQLKIVSCYGFQDALIVEKSLHQAYSKFNVRNEWFLLHDDLISKFDDVCLLLGGKFYLPAEIAEVEEIEHAENNAVSVYCFNCDSSGNHYVYTMDENNREPNGRKRRIYLWKFNDPRTTEYCGDRAQLWLSNHVCKNGVSVMEDVK